MVSDRPPMTVSEVEPFSRSLFNEPATIGAVGTGFLGGKATGLVQGSRVLADAFPEGTWDGIEVSVPRLAVLGTDLFDAFVARNGLEEAAASGEDDERIAHAFQRADFPVEFVGDLRALVETARAPLAVRSSSLLEDATHEPFAGIYSTKMVPNNQPGASTRFAKLIEAIKLVYASTYFRDARGYRERTGRDIAEEKMAVVIQEVVGRPHDERFYPTMSGVARSWNYYPVGKAKPEEGVIDLALGLGKTIVDGEAAWSFSPAHPKADPPVTVSDLLKQTQTKFWAVNLGPPPAFDPIRETEYMAQAGLADAELDGSLDFVASTYVPESDRIVMGIGRKGPRVLNFAPVIRMDDLPLVGLVKRLLTECESALGAEVEIEFAVTLDPLRREPPRLGFLQVRPIVVSREEVDLSEEELSDGRAVVASTRVMGHGRLDTLTDVVYIDPESFKKEMNPRIAQEIGEINRGLQEADRDYALVTFGRLGSSDPWLGVPVDWGQISRARVIVEATTPEFDVELSQGAHFFHNMTSLGIFYFTVPHHGPYPIRWEWLAEQEVV
ncbi:MAG: PEP/pyruvate-binding domain-containing protein, partial [Planctomycetota bacterium]